MDTSLCPFAPFGFQSIHIRLWGTCDGETSLTHGLLDVKLAVPTSRVSLRADLNEPLTAEDVRISTDMSASVYECARFTWLKNRLPDN
jgi:hypothetical protein